MNRECHHLDSYLADDLPIERAARFERHLPECGACREALDQQPWVDNLLQSSNRLQLEPVPVGLVESTRTSIWQRRRRVRLAAWGLAAAAMLLVAVGWLELNRQADGRVDRAASRGDIAENVRPEVAAPRKATFVGGADVIAVPIESHHADVTIFRIYPTYRPRDDSQTVAAEPTAPNSTWLDYSNGG